MHFFSKIIGMALFLYSSLCSSGAPMWTFIPSTSLPPKITVAPNSIGVVEYTVHNQSKKQINLAMQAQNGVEPVTECNLSPKGQSGATCLLRLNINGSQISPNGLRGGPVMCAKNANGSPNPNQCYKPGNVANNLDVALAPTPISWVANDTVFSVVLDNALNRVYIGGRFNEVGPRAQVSKMTSEAKLSQTRFGVSVFAAVPDNQGGWYVAGEFDSVGGYQRNNLAHILPDGNVDPNWNPNVNAQVATLLLLGNTLYIGGQFTQVSGQARQYLAALNAVDGSVTAWSPNPNDYVFSFANDGNRLYVGGRFTNIAGQNRGYLAAFDATTGNIDPVWNPNLLDTGSTAPRGVRAIVLNNSTAYVGGFFNQVNGGTARSNLAAFSDSGTGLVLNTWNPSSNGVINSMKIHNNIFYFGGGFSTVNGTPRSLLAAVDPNGALTNWSPSASGLEVRAIEIASNIVYVGGVFNSVNTNTTPITRSNLAAFDLTGLATSWAPRASDVIRTLVNDGAFIRVGGNITTLNAQSRNGIAALDATSSQLLDWNPDVGGTVSAMLLNEGTLYIGGSFSSVNNGQAMRNNLASLDAQTGIATSWNPDADSTVLALAKNTNTLYVGGMFDNVSGQTRRRLAAFSLHSGALDALWTPEVDNTVNVILAQESQVFFGGFFSLVNGQPRANIAKISATNGALDLGWNADTDSTVRALAAYEGKLFIGGSFFNVGMEARQGLAAVSLETGQVDTNWLANTNATVRGLLLSASTLYAVGDFSLISGQTRLSFAALDPENADVLAGTPGFTATFFNAELRAIAANGSNAYLGGDFSAVNYNPLSNFGIVPR